ncbi:membrane protein [Opitutaceae bacterium TAV5]|nr:membrane protein [Opitutaceae bacterium TAV5]
MNVRYDVELLKKRLGYLEDNLAEVKRRLAELEAHCTAEALAEAAGLAGQSGVVAGAEERPVAIPPPMPVSPPPLPAPATEEPPAPAPEAWHGLPARGLEWHGHPGHVTGNHGQDARATATVPEAAPVPPPPRMPEPAPPSPPVWKPWLQMLQLWPPSPGEGGDGGDTSTEVRLGAWWATRIGALLAVIGVAFFGAYISINTPPAVKFAELLLVSLGVTAGGLWLERKIPKFGAVVFGAGLALVYFCAFAAYALPAVKVIDSPAAATGWQLAAALLMAGAAVWRRSSLVATMATALALASAVFAQARGLPDFALVTAALLAVAGVMFHRWKKWEGPSVVAMPGAYAVYALVWRGSWMPLARGAVEGGEGWGVEGGGGPGAFWPWAFLAGMLLLHFARDWRRPGPAADTYAVSAVSHGERFFQGLNSSFALGLGFLTAFTLYREHLAAFYLVAAAVMAVLVVLRQWRMPGDVVAAILAAKATGLFALWMIEVGEGRMMAIQLLVQSWVTFAIARRLRSRFLAVWTALLALVAYGYFVRHAVDGIAVVSFAAVVALVFVTGFALLFAELGRGRGTGGVWVEMAGALLATVAAAVAVAWMHPGAWGAAALIAFAAAGILAARLRRTPGPGVAGGLLALLAHGVLCIMVWSGDGNEHLLANALAVALPTLAAGVGLARRATGRFASLAPWLWALTIFSGSQVLFSPGLLSFVHPGNALVLATALAVALAATAPRAGDHCRLTTLATWTALCAVVTWRVQELLWISRWWEAAAAVLLWSIPLLLRGSPRHAASRAAAPLPGAQEWLQTALAFLVTWGAAAGLAAGWYLPGAFAVLAIVASRLAWRPGVLPALAAAWGFWAGALWQIGGIPDWLATPAQTAVAALAVATAWIPAWWQARRPLPEAGWGRAVTPVQAIVYVAGAWLAAVRCFDGQGTDYALLAALALAVVVLRAGRVAAARWASVALAAVACCGALVRVTDGEVSVVGPGLLAVALLAIAFVALPLVVSGGPHPMTKPGRDRLRWLAGAAALFLLFLAAWKQEGALAPYVTVAWGLVAIALFMTGLLVRVRPWRLLGLAGLALCVPRVFFVDLHSTLHRIAAFVVLGLVLLWVGFSYHRFRHLIVEENELSHNPDNTASETDNTPES